MRHLSEAVAYAQQAYDLVASPNHLINLATVQQALITALSDCDNFQKVDAELKHETQAFLLRLSHQIRG